MIMAISPDDRAPLMEILNAGYEKWRFSTNRPISLNLGVIEGHWKLHYSHSLYSGRQIGTRMRSVEWCHAFPMTFNDPEIKRDIGRKSPFFYIPLYLTCTIL